MEQFSKALQSVADELDKMCHNYKNCNDCPFYKKGQDCSPATMDELVRSAKELERRADTLLEGAQALKNAMGVK